MNIEVDIWYRSKKTGKFRLFHETLDEEDIDKVAKKKTEGSLPMYMDEEEWEYNCAEIKKVEL